MNDFYYDFCTNSSNIVQYNVKIIEMNMINLLRRFAFFEWVWFNNSFVIRFYQNTVVERYRHFATIFIPNI